MNLRAGRSLKATGIAMRITYDNYRDLHAAFEQALRLDPAHQARANVARARAQLASGR
ncbi:MAG: hypothetical protein JO091_13840 [Acidobacteriaceae bacterium]|nr:hypothetical protein [Acidobacteriaceae bacterium]